MIAKESYYSIALMFGPVAQNRPFNNRRISRVFGNSPAQANIAVVLTLLLTGFSMLAVLYLDARQNCESPAGTSPVRSAMNMIAKGSPEELRDAFVLLKQAQSIDPKDPLTLFALGWASQASASDDAAQTYYSQAAHELNSLHGYIWYNLSFIAEKQGALAQAVELVESAVASGVPIAGIETRLAKLLSLAEQNLPDTAPARTGSPSHASTEPQNDALGEDPPS